METQTDHTLYLFSSDEKSEIQKHVAKYPDKRSAIMPALWVAQNKFGWLSDGAMKLVSEELGVPFTQVFGVASFYTMYLKKRVPKYLFDICTCFTCGECGGKEIFEHAKKNLHVDDKGFSNDGLFYLREAECLAACDTAPVMQVNNRRLVHRLDMQKMEKVIGELRMGKMPEFEPVPPIDQSVFAKAAPKAPVAEIKPETETKSEE